MVLEGGSGVPIYTADVALLRGDTVLNRTITDADGHFLLRSAGPGTYRVRATRMGYMAFDSDPFELGVGDEAMAELRLQLDPVELSPLEATVERPRPRKLELQGFYRRQERGVGQFLAPEDLEEMRLHFPRDLFWGMSGIRLRVGRYGGLSVYKSLGVTMTGMGAGACRLSVTVDGQVVAGGGNYNIGGGPWTDAVNVHHIQAVEVYSSAGGVPAWATRYSPCGAIIIWTR